MSMQGKIIRLKKLINMLDNPGSLTEELSVEIIMEIEQLSPDPEIMNYIFGKKYEHLTVDEIIEKAFSYKPIILGDQTQKKE